MPLEVVVRCADELATKVGPHETLVALARLEDALACLDAALDPPGESADPDVAVIDLREVRAVMERIQPVLDQAEVRVGTLRSSLDSTS